MSSINDSLPSYRHVLKSFITQSDGKQIIGHQIESFNQFIEIDIQEIIHMANPIMSRGSPEIPLAGPRSALATAIGLSTTAANALMGNSGENGAAASNKIQHEYEVTLDFEKVYIRKPTIFENNGTTYPMMPNEARLRNLTYASPLNIDVKVTTTFIDNTRNGIRESNVRIFPNVHLGKIPVMVGSKYCLLQDQQHIHPSNLGECAEDVGGYFIIQGGERAMISMERMSENRPFVFRNGRSSAKDKEIVEIKCIGPDNDQIPKSNTVKIVYNPKNQLITMIHATVPRIKTEIPIVILFRALGILADKDICELILGYDVDPLYDPIIIESILEASSITTQELAFNWLTEHTNMWSSIKTQKPHNIRDIISEELFPHIGGSEMNYEKACFLAHMVRKVLWTSTQRIPTDDRDAYPNKRVDIPGFLLADLFRKTYNNRMVKDMRAALSKEIHSGSWKATGNWSEIVNINNINKIIKSTILDVCLKSSLATGNFGSGKIGGPSKIGVSQVLNRMNYSATISHLRRISTPIEKTGKLIAPRKQHNTQWGYICVLGDTNILNGDGITSTQIIDMKDGDNVLTVNPTTLEESSSEIHHYFKTTPTRVIKIKTLSGRTIGCSPDHPLLVVRNEENIWIHAGDLVLGDKVIVKNYTVALPTNNELKPLVLSSDFINSSEHRTELKSFIDCEISEDKKQILARLIGTLLIKGTITELTPYDNTIKHNTEYLLTFNAGDKINADQICNDIKTLGFTNSYLNKKVVYDNTSDGNHICKDYYKVIIGGSFATLLVTLSEIVDNKHNNRIPSWIKNGSSSVKRELLSAVQINGGKIRTIYDIPNNKMCLDFVNDIVTLYKEFGIDVYSNESHLNQKRVTVLTIDDSFTDLAKYVSIIGSRYCVEKEKEFATFTEYILYKNMLKNESLIDRKEPLNFIEFSKLLSQVGDKIIMPITELSDMPVEDVYDFTTQSDNHDFYANGILVRNCPCETPEGHGVGVIKNMASTTSISIFSSPVTVYAFIQNLNKLVSLRDATTQQKHEHTRVFLNGSWIGIFPNNEMYEIVNILRKAKRAGQLHIFTGIVWKNAFKELWITTEAGRVLRPVYFAAAIREIAADKSGTLKQQIMDITDWNKMLLWESPTEKHLIEYLDAGETDCAYIAMDYEATVQKYSYTHCEIHPSVIFGTTASTIPFPDHNQSPRNAYQCLWENEEVLLSDGRRKYIKDVLIGDKVVVFNPTTGRTADTIVLNNYTRNTTKDIYKLTTISGREIVATEDHKFITEEGWKEVKDIINSPNKKIGIIPNWIFEDKNIPERCIIITKQQMIDVFLENNIKNTIINKYIAVLESLQLCPLYSDDARLSLLARMAGFISTSGHVSIHDSNICQVTCDFSLEEDALQFNNDMISLGFNPDIIIELNTTVLRRYSATIFNICYRGTFASLIVCLGSTLGCHTEDTINHIPTWIMNGSDNVKREFVGGYQGGYGCEIRDNIIHTYQANLLYKERLNFIKQLSSLLTYFEIENKVVKQINDKVVDRYVFEIKIADNSDNLIKYYDTIGYRYDSHKIVDNFRTTEYLKYKSILTNTYSNTIKAIRNDINNNNLTQHDISTKYSITLESVLDIERTMNNKEITMRHIQEHEYYDIVCEQITNKDKLVFVPIQSIIKYENVRVSDITVDSDYHSFITTNNIGSHNCSMGKQAMSVYALNYRERFDAMSHVLCYPEIPMVSSFMSSFYGAQKLPSGQNIIVAIMTYTGYNQEDSNMINRAALERGRFRSIFYRTYKDEERKNQSSGEEEKFCNPSPIETKHMKNAHYDKLFEDGFIPKDTYVTPDDILIGKVVPLRVPTGQVLPAGVKKSRDVSKMPRNNESGYVDKIYKNRNGEGYSFVKIRMRQDRIPEIGDKFSCYSADTDVLTQKNGWINFKDLTMSHKVATLMDDGVSMSYTTPLEVMSYDYKGRMYKIESNQVDLLVTPNHRMYVGDRTGDKFGFKLAEDIYGKRLTYKKNIENYIPSAENRPSELSYANITTGEIMNEPQAFILKGTETIITDLIVPINDWLTMFGIWMAEGCTLRSWGVSFATHKQRVKDVLEPLCNRIGLEIRKHKDAADDTVCNTWCMTDRRFVNYIIPLSVGAVNKSLPDWVWYLSPEQCQILISGMMLGDGHTMANGTRRYDTSSTKLANDFQRLCLHARYSTNISLKYVAGHESVVKQKGREGEVIKSTADAYRLTIIEKQNTPLVNKNIVAKTGENRHDSWEEYDGKVYCCRVDGPGAIYVRRNKVPVWSGNSRHGQKGTTGMILNQEDMPQTASGIVPDIIINPHAIPSRMTIAQLMETLLSKIGCMTGCLGDGSPFNDVTVDNLSTILRDRYGMEPYGNEIMYNGYTGRMMETSIFIGPCYYQRLRHCSADKMHSRAAGPLVMLTRQPAEGRAREGGLRFGEMERDCVVAHGMAEFTKERLMECSDAFSCYSCKDCGLLAIANPEQSIWACRGCGNTTNFSHINIPYATKLLLQELETMSIGSRLITQHKLICNDSITNK